MITALVFLPLLGACFTGLLTRKISARFAQLLTSSMLVLSAILSGAVFFEVAVKGEPQIVTLLTWISSGEFLVHWRLFVDSLTATMFVVVTWVSAAVHIYSIGYMDEDPHKQRFMSYLSLFTFFMLMLVSSDNFIQLFLGWEGVGLCSYLLIGFWYHKESANAAAMKAFIVNRVGDFGFALGIVTIFLVFHSVEFNQVFLAAEGMKFAKLTILGTEYHAITVICILLFIGSMGKSAQIGLHTWLPDAMEGPTPVSALIHAATMVTAGVFLVARCSPLFEFSPLALDIVTAVGAVTCLFAATIALTQNDIKKIIAYSTCSQLGYMFFACGVSAYSAAIFHLMTHGFFKALLFLGAGSVIHAMHHEQDIRHMGGIWKKIPWTYGLMWVGSLALAGVFPFAGYFSKDIILEAAFASGTRIGWYAYWFGIVAAFCTAFYSWRLLFMVFHQEPRASESTMKHVHESPTSMMVPLLFLSVGAIGAGLVGYYALGMVHPEGRYWGNAIFVANGPEVLEAAHHIPAWAKWMPMVVGGAGIFLAWLFYIQMRSLPEKMVQWFKPFYILFHNKYFIDELYHILFITPTLRLGLFLSQIIDRRIIDGLGPNGLAFLSYKTGGLMSRLQTGYLYHYAFAMVGGLVLLCFAIIMILSHLKGAA